jgi:outer membrane protein assembly factor BamB
MAITLDTRSTLSTQLNGLDGVAISATGVVYVNGPSLRAYDPSGTPMWTTTGIFQPTQASIGSDGTVYFGSGSRLFALRPDGTERWRTMLTESGPTGAPAIAADGTIYTGTEFALYAIDPAAGAIRWRVGYGNSYNGPPAVGADGTVYVARYIAVHAFRPDGVGRWDFPLPLGNAITSAAYVGPSGDVYFGFGSSTTFQLVALAPTGVERWRRILPAPARTIAIAPDGTIWAACDATLVAISPMGAELRRVSGVAFAQPLIASDGTIYVTDGPDLRAIRPDGTMVFTRRVNLTSHGPALAADGTLWLSGGATLTAVRP